MTVPVETFLDPQGWPLVDRLLVNRFKATVTIPGKQVQIGTALVDDGTEPPERMFPAIRVQRLPGGGINTDGYEDVNRIEITTWGTTRPESDALTAQVRAAMYELDNDEWAGVGLDRIREETGPGRIPDPNQDLRAVPTVWIVVARQQ